MTTRNVSLVLLLPLAALVQGSCKSRAREEAAPARPAHPGAASAPAPVGARAVIIEAAGRRAFALSLTGDTITVDGAEGAPGLVGELRPSGKRKYRQGDGSVGDAGRVIAEVKSRADGPAEDESGFKVRAPDGKLLWKVRIAAEKIKIAANEEGTAPWVISLKHADKVKVTDQADRELGSVRYHAAGARVEVRDAGDRELYSARTDLRSALFAILLIDDIPVRDKQILMAELLARGY